VAAAGAGAVAGEGEAAGAGAPEDGAGRSAAGRAARVRVLHVNTERTWRGGEQQVLYLLRGLRAAGLEQELLCQPEGVLAARAREQGVEVWLRRMRGEVDLPAALAIARRIRERRFDVVHMHTSHAHTLGVLGAMLAGRPRPRTVISRRVDFSIHRRPLLDFSRQKYTWGVDRILCVSETIRRVLLADGLPAPLLGVVHSGIDLSRFQDVPDRAHDYRREFGVPRDGSLVLNVAHCADHKGQRYLVAAAPAVLARHPGARLVIAGDGEVLGDLKAQAAELGVADHVLFPGFRTDVPALLRAADVFCFPSHFEGLGTSVLDALAMRRPVVSTTAGGIPEMIESGVHGLLVPPRDPGALAAALSWMLEHPQEAAAMGAEGRRRVEREFTCERTAQRTLEEYRRLLAEPVDATGATAG
jgi:glycosyltransferase involved in cell wall biosynthesis